MLAPGTIVMFDELINYHGWEEGEFKAFMEFVAAGKLAFEYVAYNRTGGQVAVRILGADHVDRDRALSGWRRPTQAFMSGAWRSRRPRS